MQRKLITLLLLGVLSLRPLAYAADIEGRWLLSVQDKKRTLVGLLEIEKAGEGWIAYLEGGPASVATDGDNVVIVADSRDVRGFVFNRRMTGKIDGDSMRGTYAQEGAAAQAEQPGPWRAVREYSQATMAKAAKPVDLSGTWTATKLLSFKSYGSSPAAEGLPSTWEAGKAIIRVQLFVGGNPVAIGTLTVGCILPGVEVPGGAFEGSTLSVQGGPNFNKADFASTLFILQP